MPCSSGLDLQELEKILLIDQRGDPSHFFNVVPPLILGLKFFSSWRFRPPEHGFTHHGEAWTIKLFHLQTFNRLNFAKIGLCDIVWMATKGVLFQLFDIRRKFRTDLLLQKKQLLAPPVPFSYQNAKAIVHFSKNFEFSYFKWSRTFILISPHLWFIIWGNLNLYLGFLATAPQYFFTGVDLFSKVHIFLDLILPWIPQNFMKLTQYQERHYLEKISSSLGNNQLNHYIKLLVKLRNRQWIKLPFSIKDLL